LVMNFNSNMVRLKAVAKTAYKTLFSGLYNFQSYSF
jgi:hypothetical protein